MHNSDLYNALPVKMHLVCNSGCCRMDYFQQSLDYCSYLNTRACKKQKKSTWNSPGIPLRRKTLQKKSHT